VLMTGLQEEVQQPLVVVLPGPADVPDFVLNESVVVAVLVTRAGELMKKRKVKMSLMRKKMNYEPEVRARVVGR